ncbi:hypothetical protein OBE_02354 [human gut metagenome]|uniref:Uncharacterized protein n=1 Tax=human gut metagenome TaxID=408170 RepID=K1UPV3_9ZZZZ
MYGEMLADVENVDDAAEEMGMAFLKGRTLADEIEALATLTVDDVNKALQTMPAGRKQRLYSDRPEGMRCNGRCLLMFSFPALGWNLPSTALRSALAVSTFTGTV